MIGRLDSLFYVLCLLCQVYSYLNDQNDVCRKNRVKDGFPCVKQIGNGNITLSCIGKYSVCDGKIDCADGSDEKNCPNKFKMSPTEDLYRFVQGVCPRSFTMCKTGFGKYRQEGNIDSRCFYKTFICDGDKECVDGSDERYCPYESNFPPIKLDLQDSYPLKKKVSMTNSFECESNQSGWVDKRFICDGYKDCKDASDEKYCPVDYIISLQDEIPAVLFMGSQAPTIASKTRPTAPAHSFSSSASVVTHSEMSYKDPDIVSIALLTSVQQTTPKKVANETSAFVSLATSANELKALPMIASKPTAVTYASPTIVHKVDLPSPLGIPMQIVNSAIVPQTTPTIEPEEDLTAAPDSPIQLVNAAIEPQATPPIVSSMFPTIAWKAAPTKVSHSATPSKSQKDEPSVGSQPVSTISRQVAFAVVSQTEEISTNVSRAVSTQSNQTSPNQATTTVMIHTIVMIQATPVKSQAKLTQFVVHHIFITILSLFLLFIGVCFVFIPTYNLIRLTITTDLSQRTTKPANSIPI